MYLRKWTSAVIIVVICAAQVQGMVDTDVVDNAALAYWPAFALLPELDDAQENALRKAVQAFGPIDDTLESQLDSSNSALAEMRRGALSERCDWGTAVERGPGALLIHLSKARTLARFSCARARLRFEQGRAGDAIDDLANTMVLARHVGSDGILISMLVQIAIEQRVINIAAHYLPTLDEMGVNKLVTRMKDLPPSQSLSDAVNTEKEIMLGWFIRKLSEPGGKEAVLSLFPDPNDPSVVVLKELPREALLQTAIELRPLYDQLSELAQLPPDELDTQAESVMKPQLQGAVEKLAGLLLPGVINSRRAEAIYQARVAMFRAAIGVTRDGKVSLNRTEFQDPFGSGPFTYAETPGGFELRSQLVDREGNPVKLAFGSEPKS